MTTETVTVRNGDAGPDYDVIVDVDGVDAVAGKLALTGLRARRDDVLAVVTPADGAWAETRVDQHGRLWTAAATSDRLLWLTAIGTTSAGAYAAGDQVAGLLTFTGASLGRGGRVINAVLTDRPKQKANLTLWLFHNSPTLAGSDNNPFDMTDALLETASLIGHIDFNTAAYRDTVSSSACGGSLPAGSLSGNGLAFGATATGNIFGVLTTSGTPTYGAVAALQVSLAIQQN